MKKQIIPDEIIRNRELKHKKRNSSVVFFLLFLALGAGTIYSCKNGNTSGAANQPVLSAPATGANDSLQSQVNAARLQVDDLSSKTACLDSQVRLKDEEIAKLQKERAALARKNKSLGKKLRKDDKLVASLKKDLDDKDKMYAEKLGLLQSDKDNLNSQLSDLMKKYSNLKALGSVLHASDIRIEALHVKRRSRREKITRRAKKLNILRIHFDIDENRIAEDGTKELYLVINGPDGKLLSNEGNNPGEFTSYKDSEISYSVRKNIFLKQNEPVNDVTVDWDQRGEHEKGDYKIAIYNGGYKIGAGNVELN